MPEGRRAALGVMQRGLASRDLSSEGFIEISTSVSEGQSVLWRPPPIRRECVAASPHFNERSSGKDAKGRQKVKGRRKPFSLNFVVGQLEI